MFRWQLSLGKLSALGWMHRVQEDERFSSGTGGAAQNMNEAGDVQVTSDH